MSYPVLYILWAALFALTAGLGFLPNPQGAALIVLRCLSVLFFLPPVLILYKAKKAGFTNHRKLINRLSIASLGLTLLVLVFSFLSANGSEAMGQVLHVLLVIISAPMECSHIYALSLFLWACLMFATFPEKRKA